MRFKSMMFLAVLCVFIMSGCGLKNSDKAGEEAKGTTSAMEATEIMKTTETMKTTEAMEAAEAMKTVETGSSVFLEKANEVTVSEDSVTFTDALGNTVTVPKGFHRVVNLYGSLTTLWYEAGGSVIGCIGGDSAIELYKEYIGRDITQDEQVTVLATSSAGKNWDVESILALKPQLIICSTAMSGYSTIEGPAKAAGIPVIAVDYNDFSDYLKWFKVFCNLTGEQGLWDDIAMASLKEVTEVLKQCPTEQNPKVFSMFFSSKELKANTGNTLVGQMMKDMNAINIVDEWKNENNAERLDINLETVYAADPDIIIVQTHAGEEACRERIRELYGDNPVWNSLKAVKNNKVFYLEKTLFHNKPNHKFAQAYVRLYELLYQN